MPKTIANRYKVVRLLGEGASGKVYLVADKLQKDKRIALKLLEAPGVRHLELLRHEFTILTKLQHPNIAQVYDFGFDEESGFWFYTSEFLKGKDIIKAGKKLTYAARSRLFAQVLRALQHIHSRGIVHYDVKPSNIIVDTDGAAKLIDFGLATTATPITGAMRGTVGYAAPEVVRGELGDPRSDLYSLGSAFYESLAGRRPFIAESAIEVLRTQAKTEPEPIHKIDAKVPQELDRLILRLLERNPVSRFQSANEANRALSQAMDISLQEETVETAMAYLLSGGFIGRDEEFKELQDFVDVLKTDFTGASVRFITGVTGIGKSSLLREAGYYAQLSGIMLVNCRSKASDSRLFGPFADVVRAVAHAVSEEVREEFSDILKLFAGEGEETETGAEERNRIIHETALLLERAAKERPIIISIDDMEEADEDALAFLEHLTRILWLSRQENEQVTLLVIGACNSEVASAKPTMKVIDRVVAQGFAEKVSLSPISREAGKELLTAMLGGSELPGQVTGAVLDAAGGNPLIIVQTVQQLFDSGMIFYEAGKWRASAGLSAMKLPTAGGEVLKKRLETLSKKERSAVEALACVGRPAEFGLLAAAADMPTGSCAAAVGKLLSTRLIIADEEGGYSFASGNMREVVLDRLNKKRRRDIHKRLFSYLEKSNGDVIEHALHADMAEIEEKKLLPLLWEAAERAEQKSITSSAVRLFEALRRRVPEKTEKWFEAASRLGVIYWRSARLDKAFDCAKKAVHEKLWQYPKSAARVAMIYASASVSSGKVDKAEQFVENALKRKSAKKSDYLRASLLTEIGHIKEFKADMEEAYRLFSEARAVFASIKDKRNINKLDYHLAVLDMKSGRYSEALKRANQLLKRKSAAYILPHIHNILGTHYHFTGRKPKALHHYELALKEYEETGQLLNAGCVQVNIGASYKDMNEFDKALDAFSEAKRLFQVSGDDENYGATLKNSGDVHLELGRTREALSFYEQTIELAEKTSNSFMMRHGILSRGMVNYFFGRTKDALDDYETVLRMARESGDRSLEINILTKRGNTLALMCGDFDAAEDELEKALEIADDPLTRSGVLAISARLSAINGKNDEALAFVEQAKKLNEPGVEQRTVDLAKAEVFIATGRIAPARKILSRLGKTQFDMSSRIWTKMLNARCLLKEGDGEAALGVAEDAMKSARHIEHAAHTFEATALAAVCALAVEDAERAAKYFAEAEEVFDKIAAGLPEKYDRQQLRSSSFFKILGGLEEHLEKPETKPEKTPPSVFDLGLKKEELEDAGVDGRLLAREGLVLLGMVNRLAAAEPDVEKLLGLSLGMALDVTQAERGFIILVDEEGQLKHLTARNVLDEEITSPEYETSHTMVREVIRTGKPRLVSDVALDESLRDAKSVVDLGLHSVICMPIIHEERTIGVVYLDSISLMRSFSDADMILMETFAERIAPVIVRAIEQEQVKFRLRSLEEEVRTRYAYTNIIGRSEPMRNLFKMLDSVTDTDLTVYIYGKTGTGKELVAKALHYNSSRKDAPFVSINCAAMTESLLESELFGYVKGAFTGAAADKAGLIEAAAGGTLFMDEIGSMNLEMQAKLLRALEEREVRRIGAAIPVPVDIRLVCSTNIPLEELVERGHFREDLFYRINVVRLDLPPLSERREDIPLLAEHFLEEFAKELKTEKKTLEPDAQAKLLSYNYPGNIRQLRNILQQAFVITDGPISHKDIENVMVGQEHQAEPESAVARRLSIDEYVKEFILAYQHQLSETELARVLGIDRTTLWHKRKKWNLSRPE